MAKKKKSGSPHSKAAPSQATRPETAGGNAQPSPGDPPLYLLVANPPRPNRPLLIGSTLLAIFWLACLITLAWLTVFSQAV